MSRFFMILTVIAAMTSGEVTHGTFGSDRLPQNASIDANNANDAALVQAFGSEDKASLWKKLGVHFRKGEVRVVTLGDSYKYHRTNSDLLEMPGNQRAIEDTVEDAVEDPVEDAEALMYFLFPRVNNRDMSIDEVNKILNIPEERMSVIEHRWERFKMWANPPYVSILMGIRILAPEDISSVSSDSGDNNGAQAS